MRIAYVVSRWGEPTETFIRREAIAARRAGHDIVALSLKPPGPQHDDVPVVHLAIGQVARHALRRLLRRPGAQLHGLLRALRSSRPRNAPATTAAWVVGMAWASAAPPVDWIHAHFAWVAATAADALATGRNQRYSVFPHAHDIFEHRLADGYTRDKLSRAAFVVVESELIQDEVRARFGCAAAVQRMGVPPEMVVDEVRRRSSAVVVSVGSLAAKKGHDDLVRAIARLDGVALRIVGDGPERHALQQLVDDLGVGGRVQLPGWATTEEVLGHLDDAAVFCLASKPSATGDRDGVPNVLIEAMARGVPVVSTRVSGIPDLLADDCGLLVDPGDVDGLAEAIGGTLGDPDAAALRATRALERVRAHYTTDVNWRQLEARITAARTCA